MHHLDDVSLLFDGDGFGGEETLELVLEDLFVTGQRLFLQQFELCV